MKKIISILSFMWLMMPNVSFADWGRDGYGMMGGGGGMWLWGGLVGLVYFAIGSFIFSAIFWLTHKWISKK